MVGHHSAITYNSEVLIIDSLSSMSQGPASSWPLLVTFVVYLLGILLLGIRAYQQTHDLGDYLLGGRKLGSE